MTTTIMIHNAKRVECNEPDKTNCNAITLAIETLNGDFRITLFDLEDSVVDRIYEGLVWPKMSELQIRADERRKIAIQLGLSEEQ